jgi:hypothetical protein
MNIVRFDEHGYFAGKDGKPFYMAGINYVPRYICTNFWEDWRPDRITHDLDMIRSLGLNAVRLPVHWNTFEPEEGKMDPAMLAHFDQFIAWCKERELYMMPWFLVGAATCAYDVNWRRGRSFFEESMTAAEENHLRTFAARYRNEEQILIWDICDEPEWYSRICPEAPDTLPYPTEAFTKWVGRMYHAFKDIDGNHLVTLAFGHIATGNYGMDLKGIADILDVMAVTAYTGSDIEALDKPRPGYQLAFHQDMNRRGGPVFLCECPGQTDIAFSREEIARYYGACLYGSWLHGSAGVMPWVLNDFEEAIWGLPNFDRNPEEIGFGVVKENNEVKPAGRRLERFARRMREISAAEYEFPKTSAAVLVPRGYIKKTSDVVKKLIPMHAAMCTAGLLPEMHWWDDAHENCPLIVVTAGDGLGASGWKPLRDYIEQGGTLLCMEGFGQPTPYFEQIFGLHLHSGKEKVPGLSFTFLEDFGKYKSGEMVHLADCGPIIINRKEVCGARVIAAFPNGWPAITEFRAGKGKTYFFAANFLAGFDEFDNATWRSHAIFDLLEAVAEKTGIIPLTKCPDRGVETGLFRRRDGKGWLLAAVNRDDSCTETWVQVQAANLIAANTTAGNIQPYSENGTPLAYTKESAGLRIPVTIEPGDAALIRLE